MTPEMTAINQQDLAFYGLMLFVVVCLFALAMRSQKNRNTAFYWYQRAQRLENEANSRIESGARRGSAADATDAEYEEVS